MGSPAETRTEAKVDRAPSAESKENHHDDIELIEPGMPLTLLVVLLLMGLIGKRRSG